MNLADEKKLLRSSMKNKIKEFCALSDVKKESLPVCRKVLELKEFKSCEIFLAYIPLKNEADCFSVIKEALALGKTVAVPRVKSGTCNMDFYELSKDKSLEEQLFSGAFGILEPKSDLELFDIDFPVPAAGEVSCDDSSIFMLVPGLAFTRDGKRLGKGMGFYDRYLERMMQGGLKAFLCGFCLPCQIIEDIPCDILDVKMNRVLF